MNSRKINDKRRQQRMNNLITGLINHFGESSFENLTENVLIRSNQSMDYVNSAVCRSLRNGVRHGFIEQTTNNTFKLPGRSLETDTGFNWRWFDECKTKAFEAQRTAKNGSTRKCVAKDVISHNPCTYIAEADSDHCEFHIHVESLLDYRIEFVIHFDKLDDVIKQNEEFEKTAKYLRYIQRTITDQNIINIREKLVEYLTKYEEFILTEDNGTFWMENRPPIDEGLGVASNLEECAVHVSRENECYGLDVITGCRCTNKVVIKKGLRELAGFRDLCPEHQYISLLLKGFARYSNEENESNSYFSSKIQTAMKEFVTLKFSKCVVNYMALFFRHEMLLITGVTFCISTFSILDLIIIVPIQNPYLEPTYDNFIWKNVNYSHEASSRTTAGRCACMPKSHVLNMFKRFPRVPDTTKATVSSPEKRRSASQNRSPKKQRR